jgi:hypothetical protein
MGRTNKRETLKTGSCIWVVLNREGPFLFCLACRNTSPLRIKLKGWSEELEWFIAKPGGIFLPYP